MNALIIIIVPSLKSLDLVHKCIDSCFQLFVTNSKFIVLFCQRFDVDPRWGAQRSNNILDSVIGPFRLRIHSKKNTRQLSLNPGLAQKFLKFLPASDLILWIPIKDAHAENFKFCGSRIFFAANLKFKVLKLKYL